MHWQFSKTAINIEGISKLQSSINIKINQSNYKSKYNIITIKQYNYFSENFFIITQNRCSMRAIIFYAQSQVFPIPQLLVVALQHTYQLLITANFQTNIRHINLLSLASVFLFLDC